MNQVAYLGGVNRKPALASFYQMSDLEGVVIRGIKLAKVKHSRAASDLWIKAAKLGNHRAIRLLARIMLNDIHGGREEQRSIVLAALKSASTLGSRYERLYLLFDMLTSPKPGLLGSVVRLARSGDEVAALILGRNMSKARSLGNYEHVIEFYGCLVQCFVETHNVHAARVLADQLRIDGCLLEASSLLVWAANRGEFAALCFLPGVAQELGLGLLIGDSERNSVFALAEHKTFVCHDAGVALWLGLCFGDQRLGLALDIVARIRMFRLAHVADLHCTIPPVFGGETLWTLDLAPRFAGFELLYEEPIPSDQLFNILLVSPTDMHWTED